MRRPYVALDTETTGLEAGRDELIEVAAVRFQDAEVLGTWHSLVKPAGPLPEAITRLTGITADDLAAAPMFYTLIPELARFIGDAPVVGHSVGFDLDFLAAQGLPLPNDRIDTHELSTLLLPELPERSLGSVARSLGIALPEQHRALADAQTVRQVFLALRQRLLELDLVLLEEAVRLAGQARDWPLRTLLEEVLVEAGREAFGKRRPSTQPLAKRLVRPEERPDPLVESGDEHPLDSERLAEMLTPEGLFGRAFPHYEYRPQQVEMLRAVVRTFNHGGQLIVEAGTGTGKSVAYLIPAVALAVRRGRPVVVSTNTINLQDQLFYKDLPDLQRVLAQAGPGENDLRELAAFRAALLKGRNNYICLRRWESLRRSPNLTPEQVSVLVKTLLWLPRTATGDRVELALVSKEYSAWNDVASHPAACGGVDCPYQQQDRCFFYRARRRGEAAHVLVVNHALLLADVATENRVLPAYRYLIVDEAHHLESAATNQLGFHITAEEILGHLAAISRVGSGGREEGLLSLLPALWRDEKVPPAARQTMETLCREVRAGIEPARQATQAFFNTLDEFLRQNQEGTVSNQYETHWRITPQVRIQPDWSEVEIAWEEVARELLRIRDRLARIYQLCLQMVERPAGDDLDTSLDGPRRSKSSAEAQDLLLEVSLAGQRTAEILEQVTAIVSQGKSNGIYWVSLEPQNHNLGLHAAPLHVGELLRAGLYRQKEALVLTSATLSTDGSAAFLRERLGLPEADELLLDSPFDYARAALLLVPEDMPDPRDPQYARALARILVETGQASEGRMLVLFTSHSALRQAHAAIRRALERQDIAVLGQGIDGSRHVLLDKFRRNPRSVLLGTSSFWEGIDVVGEALSVLVIAKLPFTVPSDPVFAARCELFEDAFYQYAVPQTVLRFKQGFGRLIRSQTDRGVVILLDGRVLTRAYGPTFLHSLPPATMRKVPLLSIPRLVREWLGRPAATGRDQADGPADEGTMKKGY